MNFCIDYSDFVVAVNVTCRPECIMDNMEDLILNNPEVILWKQANITRIRILFVYGIEQNQIQHPDTAVAAILVQARYDVHAMYHRKEIAIAPNVEW